ncbi:hypothetical protein ABGN05_07655 [Aquibium sp. LZ166]|uniref:Uncharacterized protein n=1 Tax=Aquibium pacificus TaxID=3153579 RepID=A0ABV3SFN2_9HYPH
MLCDKSRENRIRRRFRMEGYRLRKTPARSSLREHFGTGYLVLDSDGLGVLGFDYSFNPYSATLEEVEEFVAEL